MVDFGSSKRYITVIKFARPQPRWQQSVTAIADGGTVQIILPSSQYITSGNFKVKPRFYTTNHIERFDIAYHISPTGLMTLYLPLADDIAIATFTGYIYFTQRITS
jgi:hypothetical protein